MEFIIVSSIVMFALLESRFDGLSEAVYDFIILSALGSLDKNILEQTRRFCERVRIFVLHVRLSDCQIVRLSDCQIVQENSKRQECLDEGRKAGRRQSVTR
jgi:hypothetical protein